MLELPMLYSKDAKSKLLQWCVWSDGDIVVIEHGQVGGKQTRNQERALPTNVGRANERLGDAQATFQAQAAWEKKIKQGYLESMEEAKTAELILPMLAHPIIAKSRNSKGVRTEKKRNVLYPAHVQRKLNGLRCLASIELDGSVTLKSRQGTVWDTLGHIEAAVAEIGKPGDIFDGEIYCHGIPLQQINGLIKNGTDPEVAQARLALQFHIYDMPARGGSKNGTWMERYEELRAAFQRWNDDPDLTWYYTGQYAGEFSVLAAKTLVMVGTYSVTCEEEVKNFAAVVVVEGYEGVIIRQTNMGYTFGKRKDALIKWKDFIDEEFIITDVRSREYFDTTSSFDILDKCVCQNNLDEQTFEVVPLGTIPEKQRMWGDRETLIGKRLVVRYLERSEGGIPQGNPVGIAFRLDEDMPLDDDEESMWD